MGGDASSPDVLDPALEEGAGPSGCAESLCGADRTELPAGTVRRRSAPETVVPEPPRIERILRQSELANPGCLSDCPAGAGEGHACSRDCEGRVIQPSLPAFRTTTDGRVALTGGGRAAVSASRLDGRNARPLVERGLSLHQQAFSRELDIDASGARVPPGRLGRSGSPDRFFCGVDQAPRACGDDDCYDVVLVEDWQGSGDAECPNGWRVCGRFAAAPVRIRVRDPKTADAVVVEARTTGDWTASAPYPAHTAEPIATADGRLVVFRLLGGHPLPRGVGMTYDFVRDDGSVHRGGRYSLSYVYSDDPCDVRAWFSTTADGAFRNLRPLSAAHYDRRLSRYGFAAYPLRDAYGEPFAEGDLVRGSYPWMDRHGNNVFFSTILPVGIRDETGESRFPMGIEHPRLGRPTSRSPRGFAVAGSWTHGKIVMLDGVLNNEDYGIDAGDTRRFGLYRSAGGAAVSARVDGNSNNRAFGTPGTRGNTQHMESLENTHAMHAGMAPVTPRDVVWTLARGDVLEEVVFDDMVDPHVVLFAPMNAAWRMGRTLGGGEQAFGSRRGGYRDGFRQEGGVFVHDPSEIELQNAATSPVLPVARRGVVRGEARVEPVAQGGVHGRGLWLEPEASARFDFPDDEVFPDRAFYLSTFFDARASLAGGRRLMALRAGESTVHVVVHPGGVSVHRGDRIASLPVGVDHPWRRDGWHHVGALFEAGEVTILIDGDPIGQAAFPAVTLGAGARVILGGEGGGFPGARGWTDELRLVVAGAPSQLDGPSSVELLCNYARGTMASLGPASDRYVDAERSPAVRARAAAAGMLLPTERRLRCVTDYSRDLSVSVRLPEGERSLREELLERLAGDATLRRGSPRPDTRGNAFCASCHVASDPLRPAGLALDALAAGDVPVERDARAQPGQPYARWSRPPLAHGSIPAGWLQGSGGAPTPSRALSLDAPQPILEWLLPE